jgi:hypothetical protein
MKRQEEAALSPRDSDREACRIVIDRATLGHIRGLLERPRAILHADGCALCGRFVRAVALAEPHSVGRGIGTTNGRGPTVLLERLVEAITAEVAELVMVPDSEPEDGWLRGADRIAAYIDCPRSRVYALTSARRIPVHHDGSALVARRSELDRWLRDGGGRRPGP